MQTISNDLIQKIIKIWNQDVRRFDILFETLDQICLEDAKNKELEITIISEVAEQYAKIDDVIKIYYNQHLKNKMIFEVVYYGENYNDDLMDKLLDIENIIIYKFEMNFTFSIHYFWTTNKDIKNDLQLLFERN